MLKINYVLAYQTGLLFLYDLLSNSQNNAMIAEAPIYITSCHPDLSLASVYHNNIQCLHAWTIDVELLKWNFGQCVHMHACTDIQEIEATQTQKAIACSYTCMFVVKNCINLSYVVYRHACVIILW